MAKQTLTQVIERLERLECEDAGIYKRISRLSRRIDLFSRRAYALRDLVQRIGRVEKNIDSNAGRVAALEKGSRIILEPKENLRRPECHAPVDYARAEERVAAHVLRAQDEERRVRRERHRDASRARAAVLVVIVVFVFAVIGGVTVVTELVTALG